MLTAHLLTKNNEKTIAKTLESLQPFGANIIVGDTGSTDRTIDICENYNVNIVNVDNTNRSCIRNSLIKEYGSEINLMIEPWEIISNDSNLEPGYSNIINQYIVTKEKRVWKKGVFINPVFESIQSEEKNITNVSIYSIGSANYEEQLNMVNSWIDKCPKDSIPYYYKSCILMATGKYDDFLRTANHFLFLEPKSKQSIMIRYYLTIVYLSHKKEYKPALQNINLCLCERPLMAEFWCVMGDVYYHLMKNFSYAKEFYENAIIIGKRRINDTWPMDISKYRMYPEKMINSCIGILKNKSIFFKKTQGD